MGMPWVWLHFGEPHKRQCCVVSGLQEWDVHYAHARGTIAVDVHSCGDEFTDVKFLSKLQQIVNTCSTSVSLSALYCCGEVLWECVSLLCLGDV